MITISKGRQIVKTYQDYLDMCERVEGLVIKAGDWCPTLDEFYRFMDQFPNRDDNLSFLTWIVETYDGDPKPEQKEALKQMKKVIFEETKDLPDEEGTP